MAQKTRSRLWIAAGLLLVATGVRVYPELVPWGAPIQPFVLASESGPTLTSPDGRRSLQVYFNDAGATHSGNHWTWVVENHWLTGPTVVSEGYLGPAHRGGEEPVPLTWSDGNSFRIAFAPSRHD